MKKYMLLAILFSCFMDLSVVIACSHSHVCDAGQYGYRRALLQNPDALIIPLCCDNLKADPIPSYRDYFKDVAEKAQNLRKCLIETSALGQISKGKIQEEISSNNGCLCAGARSYQGSKLRGSHLYI